MELGTARNAYINATRKASDVSRNLAFAGIGVIWLFTIQADDGLALTQDLLLSLIGLALALALDLLHYVVRSVIWGTFARWNEHTVDDEGNERVRDDDEDIGDAPPAINWFGNSLFAAKIFFVVTAYVFLIKDLAARYFVLGGPEQISAIGSVVNSLLRPLVFA